MKVSIIIPSFNEAPTLKTVVEKLLATAINFEREIIIIDDGSTDTTFKIFEKLRSIKGIKLIKNKSNLGKGASILAGLKIANGEIILIQDADLEYNPQDIPKLLSPFENKKTQVVYGSRMLEKNPVSHWTFNLGGQLVTFVTNILFNAHITDEPTGYKVFRANLLRTFNLKSKRFDFCPEVTAKIAKKGIKIYEVPITYKPRPVNAILSSLNVSIVLYL